MDAIVSSRRGKASRHDRVHVNTTPSLTLLRELGLLGGLASNINSIVDNDNVEGLMLCDRKASDCIY